jgi:AAA family ATP:ADP antiporter
MKGKVTHHILKVAVEVEPKEVAATLWSCAYFFCLLCGYYILRPVRDEMGIQAGVDQLQWLFTGTFLTMLAVVPSFGWLSSRFPRRQFLVAAYLFFAANLMVFYALFKSETLPLETAGAFFIWLSVFNLFVVSVFWSFMADLFTNAQARRLYGFIAAGGSTGAIAGSLIVKQLVIMMGAAELLPISTCFLLAAVLCISRLSTWARKDKPANTRAGVEIRQPIGGSIFGGLTLLLRSDYLLGIALYIVLFTLLSTFLYFQKAHIVSAAVSDTAQRVELFALIDLFVSALTVLGQLLLLKRIIGRFGLTVALVLLPAIAVAGFFMLGLFPTLAVLIVFGTIGRAGEYAISKPARDILFTVVSREEKYKVKNFLDTAMIRGSGAVSGWLVEGLRLLGAGVSGLAFVAVPIAMLWATTAYLIGQRQEQLRAALNAKRIYPPDNSELKTPISAGAGDGAHPATNPYAGPR